MQHFLDLFTPETWDKYRSSDQTVTGFRVRQRRIANERVKEGDLLLCWLTRISRWCGVLEVTSEAYEDESPIFDDPDPFIVRFKVKPLVVLDAELSIPIREDAVWNGLTITKKHEKDYRYWSGPFRRSLYHFADPDGRLLVKLLRAQQESRRTYPLSQSEVKKLAAPKVHSPRGEVEVEIPEIEDPEESPEEAPAASSQDDVRESIRVQASVAEIGAKMGFEIWVPNADRSLVISQVPESLHSSFLKKLPLNYEANTLRTVEQIDVLWLKGRAMVRAFEIEHTTAIYSGILRMADLLALQPNIDIRLNIVAPEEKRNKVFAEIRRPVFSLLEGRLLREQCAYLSYDSIKKVSAEKFLSHMNDTIIEEYEEFADV
ncbi:MAG: EVE domain-containing protein [bacterium]|nr:EVE domain-containing protein [bacterium]